MELGGCSEPSPPPYLDHLRELLHPLPARPIVPRLSLPAVVPPFDAHLSPPPAHRGGSARVLHSHVGRGYGDTTYPCCRGKRTSSGVAMRLRGTSPVGQRGEQLRGRGRASGRGVRGGGGGSTSSPPTDALSGAAASLLSPSGAAEASVQLSATSSSSSSSSSSAEGHGDSGSSAALSSRDPDCSGPARALLSSGLLSAGPKSAPSTPLPSLPAPPIGGRPPRRRAGAQHHEGAPRTVQGGRRVRAGQQRGGRAVGCQQAERAGSMQWGAGGRQGGAGRVVGGLLQGGFVAHQLRLIHRIEVTSVGVWGGRKRTERKELDGAAGHRGSPPALRASGARTAPRPLRGQRG